MFMFFIIVLCEVYLFKVECMYLTIYILTCVYVNYYVLNSTKLLIVCDLFSFSVLFHAICVL